MESMCQKCGGLIGEPGKAYGWTGKWCLCAWQGEGTLTAPKLFVGPPARAEPLRTLVLGAPGPQRFLQWLRGYLDGGGSDMQCIAAELKKVLP